jgi:hypothetical protein
MTARGREAPVTVASSWSREQLDGGDSCRSHGTSTAWMKTINRLARAGDGHCSGIPALRRPSRMASSVVRYVGSSDMDRSAAAGPVRSANLTAADRRRAALEAAPLRFRMASRCQVHIQVHGVVLRFLRAPLPPAGRHDSPPIPAAPYQNRFTCFAPSHKYYRAMTVMIQKSPENSARHGKDGEHCGNTPL